MIETSLDPRHRLTAIASELLDARLEAGSTIRFTVPTPSMSPSMVPGDWVIVGATNPSNLSLGDILVIRQQGGWLAHRLIGRSIKNGSLLLLLKGDNNAEADNPYSTEALYGLVESVEHAGRATSLRSKRAIRLGRVIARLSALELSVVNVRPRILKRILSKAGHLLVHGSAWFGKQLIQ